MEGLRCVLLLLYTAYGVSLLDGFNVDVSDPETFSGSKEDFFGFWVQQYQSETDRQIIVSAPLTSNQSGSFYSCKPNEENCSLIHQQESDGTRFFGMSMAMRSTPAPVLTSCSPSVSHVCDGNSYLNGICSSFNSDLQPITTHPTGVQECRKNVVNLVFLFDGSASMKTNEFQENKKFICRIMTHLKNTTIQFAAVQFSYFPRTVFTFDDYAGGTAWTKLDQEEHMKNLTNTHRAIDYVLENLFDNVELGADPKATKALVIITDGAPSDTDRKFVIKRCEDQQILRFVIGVGKVEIKNLQSFSSEPRQNNTFYITNYSGLEGLLDKLQDKIYNIEGGHGSRQQDRTKELSQSGFSAVYDKEVLVLGAVGSNEWRGLLYEVKESKNEFTEMEIKDPTLNTYSYMGYSVAVGQRGNVSLLFSGAPRSRYTGQVTLFSKRTNTWDVTTTVKGDQVGSYFGGSLCVLDVDSDGEMDFLVVGAPVFHQVKPRREGRMYVYRLTDQLELERQQEVSDCVEGRFAASLTSLSDLNGDELQDVAVGAPLEDDGRGAIYIYLGNRTQGIRPQYSQRILARTLSEQLQQFGVAIDGTMDMEGDGLTDIVVGARGSVVLFRTRPVLSVSAELSFSPSEISLDLFECPSKADKGINVVVLRACFSMEETTKSTGEGNAGLNVSYELSADSLRHSNRAFFQREDKKSRTLQTSVLLSSESSCFNHTVYMTDCVKDTLSPVLIRLIFSQAEQQPSSSKAILNIDSRTEAFVEVPFQRNCGNVSCVADLHLDFHFLSSTLLVVDQSYFNINVSLFNKGDDSFNTSVELRYPLGLSLSMFDTITATRRTLTSCGDRDDGALDKTTCSISLPVYRKGTSATFQGKFRIIGSYEWNDTMDMTLVANSDNNGNLTEWTVVKSLPVQFAVDVAVKLFREKSVTYLNFSLKDKGPKPVHIIYRVSNLGVKGLPVSVHFMMLSEIGKNYTLKKHSITVKYLTDSSSGKESQSANLTHCSFTAKVNHPSCLDQTSCVRFECPSVRLERESVVEFNLTAQLTFLNPEQLTGVSLFDKSSQEELLWSSAELDFNRILYKQTSNGPQDDATRSHRAQARIRTEIVIPPNKNLIISVGAGCGFVLLIIFTVLLVKCGFFKRKHPYQPCAEDEEHEDGGQGESVEKEKETFPCKSQSAPISPELGGDAPVEKQGLASSQSMPTPNINLPYTPDSELGGVAPEEKQGSAE